MMGSEANVTTRGPSEAGLSNGEVKTQLDKILASRGFVQTERLGQFLRYVVDETLAGRDDRLKEYSIAIEVFDRDDTFDPQTSSVVRVEASRLRTKLDEYYRGTGRDDPMVIELPRGRYVPVFRKNSNQDPPAEIRPRTFPKIISLIKETRFRAVVAISVLLLIGIATGVWIWASDRAAQSPAGESQASVAILPIRNLTGDPSQEFLSDGMTDAIINLLAKSRGLRVASLTSSMNYKHQTRSVSEMAKNLNVGHLVEGSVVRSENRIRISAKLIEAKSNRLLWSETFERTMSDVLSLHDDVAARITDSLTQRLKSSSDVGLTKRPSIKPSAYEAYLKGRFYRNKITESGFKKAIEHFKRAIALEPGFAPAHAGLAMCYCLLGGHGMELVRPHVGMPRAKKAAEQALRLNDSMAEPYAFMGIVRLKYEWDWKGAEVAFKKAIKLAPNLFQARLFYSLFLEAMGRHDEAIRQAEYARFINPLSREAIVNLGWQYLQAGKPDRAQVQFESALELEPNFWGALWGQGHYYLRQGLVEKAIESFRRAVASGGGHALPLSALGHAYAVSGRRSDALKVLDRLKAIERKTYVSPYHLATIYVGLGDDDKAFAELERAFQQRSRSLAWLNVMPEYQRLKAKPRYIQLKRRVGLPD